MSVKIVLNIVNKKQNLSYPLVFRKIAKYYWCKAMILKNFFCKKMTCYDTLEQQIVSNCVRNNYIKTFPFFDKKHLLYAACQFEKTDLIESLVKDDIKAKQELKFRLDNISSNVIKYLVNNNIVSINDIILNEHCRKGNLDLVKFLVEKGININNSNGLWMAVEYDHLEIAKYLVQNGAHVDDFIFNIAVRKNYEDIIKYFLEFYIPTAEDLYHIVLSCDLDIVKYFVEKFPNIDIKNGLMAARMNAKIDILDYFKFKLKIV